MIAAALLVVGPRLLVAATTLLARMIVVIVTETMIASAVTRATDLAALITGSYLRHTFFFPESIN